MSPPPPSLTSLLSILLILSSNAWMLQGGQDAPIQDCDEIFNYVDPLHYTLFNKGQQTWEYSPIFGLRSWFYIEIHGMFLRLLSEIFKIRDSLILIDIFHMMLVFINLFGEARLCQALARKFKSNGYAWICAFILGTSTGMCHARRAFLPSSTCMTCFTFALGEWLNNNYTTSLSFGAFSVLASWPFSALPFIPIGLDALFRRGPLFVSLVGIVCLVVFGLIPALIDSWYYGKMIWPTLQMILYNALGTSGGGAHLYGVEPFSYYFKNLFLNFNFIGVIFLGSFCTMAKSQWLYVNCPFLLHFLLYQSMPHKEERFLFVVYPAIAVGASMVLTRFCWATTMTNSNNNEADNETRIKLFHWKRVVLFIILSGFAILSMSRNIALARLKAPLWILRHGIDFHQHHRPLSISNKEMKLQEKICYGREWYRFPSSFYLGNDMEIAYVESKFSGILPQPFTSKFDNGFARIPPHMNDQNRKESSHFVHDPLRECQYVVDLNEPTEKEDVLQPFETPEIWTPIICDDFADLNVSKQPYRSFAVLWDPYYGVVKRKYCLFKRK
jgi:alpha-1,2-mannosyltransferase